MGPSLRATPLTFLKLSCLTALTLWKLKLSAYLAHHVHSRGSHFAGQWTAAAAAAVGIAACSCTKLYPTWLNPFLLYLNHRLAFCLNPLSQQQRHRNAQNMEGLSTFPWASGLRNPLSGRFSTSAGVKERVKRLTIEGRTLTLLLTLRFCCCSWHRECHLKSHWI